MDRLTLPRLRALYAEWERYPPARISAALAIGIKPVEKVIPTDQELEELMQELNGRT